MAKNVIVIDESDSGRNWGFFDKKTKRKMTLNQFVRAINLDQYPDYYTRKINGLETPVSKPDGRDGNNLG